MNAIIDIDSDGNSFCCMSFSLSLPTYMNGVVRQDQNTDEISIFLICTMLTILETYKSVTTTEVITRKLTVARELERNKHCLLPCLLSKIRDIPFDDQKGIPKVT